MIHDSDASRLTRYITGDCSPEERNEIRRWLESNPSRQELLEELQRVWKATEYGPGEWDVEAAWLELRKARKARQIRPLRPHTADANSPGHSARPATFTLPSGRSLIWIAAVITLFLGAAVVPWGSALPHHSVTSAVPGPMRLYATTRGERADLRLPDDTRVILGAETRMRVPENFGRRDRRVYLDGQAYFVVRHDQNRPFLVAAGNAIAEDLGTEFAVRSYPGDLTMDVVVAKGKVALRLSNGAPGTGTAISEGDLGRVDTAGMTAVTQGVDVSRYVAWTRGRIAFENQTLREVIPELERWFDVTIELADTSLASVPVTLAFENESSVEAIRALARLLDVRYQRMERTFRLGD